MQTNNMSGFASMTASNNRIVHEFHLSFWEDTL